MSTRREERLLVNRLAQHMNAKLSVNGDRSHWRGEMPESLLDCAQEELEELRWAIREGLRKLDVWEEAADVANFIAMAADVATRTRQSACKEG